MPVKRLAILLDTELHRRLKTLAAENNLDMSEITRDLVEQWVRDHGYPLGNYEDNPPQDQDSEK